MKINKDELKPNEISESTKTSMRTRIIAALVGLVIVLPAFFLGDWFFFALIVVLSVIAFWEIVHCGKKAYSFWLYAITIILGVVMVNWPLLQGLIANFSHGHAYEYFTSLNVSLVPMFIGICLLFLVVILHDSFTVRDGCYIIAMVLIVSLGLQSLLFVRFFPSFVNQNPRDGWFNAFDNFFYIFQIVFFYC